MSTSIEGLVDLLQTRIGENDSVPYSSLSLVVCEISSFASKKSKDFPTCDDEVKLALCMQKFSPFP
jgi:hypothetical protein